MRRVRRKISKIAAGDQHGIFQHFQSNTTDYATRERYLSQRGGDAPMGRDIDSLYNIAPEGDESRVPTEYVAPHLSTRYSPDRVGVQAKRVSDGVYQDPYTNKVYDYNEGFKTEDGRSFPGGAASLQSSLMRAANILDKEGFKKEADQLDGILRKFAARRAPSVASLASSLDERGEHEVADILDSWMRKAAQAKNPAERWTDSKGNILEHLCAAGDIDACIELDRRCAEATRFSEMECREFRECFQKVKTQGGECHYDGESRKTTYVPA
jgi:hypothetical protein